MSEIKIEPRHASYDYLLSGSKYLRCALYYDTGGWNYFTGIENKRGYYLSFRTIEKSDNFVTFSMFSDNNNPIKSYKVFIKPAKRFSKKVFKELIELFDFEQLCKEWIEDYNKCAQKYIYKEK